MVELLAPGGSVESIRAAVNAGADAVYAAGTLFGARAYAENPDEMALLDCIDHCHLHGAKLYLTVNTLMKERELEEKLYDFLLPYYRRGLDAVLVQDLGVLSFIREHFPDLPVHASTQMSIQSADGARQAAALGISRIVTARELSLEEIRRIHEETGMEIECFIHGALCYSYSGQCLLSSLIGGRSGNRGRCAQPCRKEYDLLDRDGRLLSCRDARYLLSLKDLSALELIPELIDAGVASFKIEGRMKSPLYTAGVTSIYRKYIDLYLEKGRGNFFVEEKDKRLLADLFQKRGYTRGYYHVKNSPKMMAMSLPTDRRDIQGGEEALALKREYLESAKKEKIKGSFILRGGAPAILRVSLAGRGRDGEITKDGETLADGGATRRDVISVQVSGQMPQAAEKRAVTAQEIEKQLRKTGDTPFTFDVLELEMDDDLFFPMGAVNRMRREALEQLRERILEGFGREEPQEQERAAGEKWERETAEKNEGGSKSGKQPAALHVLVSSAEQLLAVLGFEKVERVYLDSLLYLDMLVSGGRAASRLSGDMTHAAADTVIRNAVTADIARVRQSGKTCFLALPWTWREDVRARFLQVFTPEILEMADGVLLRCFDQTGSKVILEHARRIVTDANIYAWNHRAKDMLAKLGADEITLPAELNGKELIALEENGRTKKNKIIKDINKELGIYGFQQSMLTAQCLRKNTVGCDTIPSVMYLRDQRQACFPVMNHCGACMNVIYNALPLDLTDMTGELQRAGADSFRLTFTVESAKETREVLRRYFEGRREGNFTRGHMKRGVE